MEREPIGLGLRTHPASSFAQEGVLSTAPASPRENMSSLKPAAPAQQVSSSTTTSAPSVPPQHSNMAQISFGPATQQTVVTTTTTTTVTLPPLVIKPPKDLYERDPKHYPLAFSPTPHSIKRFCFDLHGRPTTFEEVEDAGETSRRFHELQSRIKRHHGSIREEEKQLDELDTPEHRFRQSHVNSKVHSIRGSNAPKRTATPPSIAEAAELASLQRKTKKPRSQLHRTFSELEEAPFAIQQAPSAGATHIGNPSPVTPDTDVGTIGLLTSKAGSSKRGAHRRSPARTQHSRLKQQLSDDEDVTMNDGESQEDESTTFKGGSSSQSSKGDPDVVDTGIATTPPIGDEDDLLTQNPEHRQRPHLASILTSSQQDASLPSPSLSPITAAANLASRNQNAFEASFARHNEVEDASVISGLDLDEREKVQNSATSFDSQQSAKHQKAAHFQFTHGAQQAAQSNGIQGPTVMDINTMVDAFDCMPETMQSYVMYQMLRRCAKPTLQMVANVVNPALKCDPFNVLPAELGLNITRFLDAQSMCRAAQVSKRWRRLINSDEKAWKDLLDRDEILLPPGEIAKAVKEGWGWQHPGEDGFEQDFSKPAPVNVSDMETTAVSDDDETCSTIATRTSSKRRAIAKMANNKKQKRRSVQPSLAAWKPERTSITSNSAHWKGLFRNAQGPIGIANAAAVAVPHPSVGLPSLKNMHLFKSLYQRHYLIRKAWMMENSKPQHLAFRAHHRHVVTCLLFDGEKILTGSDDTKINVYDTKTGALKNRLEGHEGGVWALQYEGNTLVSGSTDRSVRVWDISTGRCLQTFQGHTSTVRCLVILKPVQIDTAADGTPIMMPKEPLIITGSRDSTLRVWKLPQPGERNIYQTGPPMNDRDNPYYLRTLSGHHNSVRAIAAYGDTLVSGSYDCTVRVWKISTGDLVHRLQGHTQKVYSVVLDYPRKRCISGSMDNLVKVWDLNTGSCLFNLEGHTSLVGLLDLSNDRLVSAAADSTLRIWDPETGACKATLSAHTGAITCFQHDGHKVISGSDRTLKMWNVRNGECVRDLLTDLSGVWQVRFDERRCVAAVQRNNLTYIEVLDFGAWRDGVPPEKLGRRTVVNPRGQEIEDVEATVTEANTGDAAA
ncbi:WD40 repeat-like protein [Polychaeton citri CBS 116435]|uniref:WD40 repeat-like protein n=1 Tax=Polychaeton citri CBS 116435 TaxID=1314669 RepID=A0A9P4QHF1_9PEZI|nr:WD40 repeat-like protein [Polychaeton citri CBS 116435]